jgi:hypothetical protein
VATSPALDRGEMYVLTTGLLLIGRGARDTFNGRMARVYLYNRALAATGVAALFHHERAGS